MPEIKRNKRVKLLKDKIWDDLIDGTSSDIQKTAASINKKIQALIPKYYKKKPPMVLNSYIVARLNPDFEKIINQTTRGYNNVVKAMNALAAYEIGVEFTERELSSLSNKGSVLIDEIKVLNNRVKIELKKALLQNIGGQLTFNQMVQSLADMYSKKYQYQAYTVANTAMQRMFKDAMFTKYKNAGFGYYAYIGPDDKVTRPYCANHVKKVYTETQAQAIQAEIMTFYNCRHELVPITEEEYNAGVKGEV